MSRRRLGPALGALVLALPCLGAEPAHDPRLGGPLVSKVDWGTRSMVSADLDGDGRTDLALLNNDLARIDLLYQRDGRAGTRRRGTTGNRWQPRLEDAPFEAASVPIGIRAYSLAVGDLDGDGRADLAFTGSPDPLTVRYQGEGGEFGRRRVLEVAEPAEWTGTLLVEDLDGDGRGDLLAASKQAILVWLQNPSGELVGPETYPVPGAGCYGLRVVDLDGDGRTDVLYQVAKTEASLRVRFGRPGGKLGPEEAFRLGPTRGLVQPIELPDGRVGLLRIQGQAGLLELLVPKRVSRRDSGGLGAVRPRVFSSQVDSRSGAAYVLADVDGDLHLDVVIADSRSARLLLLRQSTPASLAPSAFPSLAGVRSIAAADVDGDGRAELFLASPQERTVAWTTLERSGRLAYPKPLSLPGGGQPQAIAAADLDGDGTVELVVVVEERPHNSLVVLHRDPSAGWTPTAVPLEGLDGPPRDVKLVDLDRDGKLDIAVFAPQRPILFLLQAEDGSFSPLDLSTGFSRGLVERVDAAGLGAADLDGDGRQEVVVATDSFARCLVLEPEHGLEVSDQFAARSSDARIAAAAVLDVDGDRSPEVVLVPRDGESLEVLHRGKDGVFRFAEEVAIDPLDVLGVQVADLDGNGAQDLLVFGKDRFVWLPLGVAESDLSGIGTWESELEDTAYQLLAAGDLDSDGRQDIVAIDTRESRVLQLLAWSPTQGFEPMLHFRVFDADPHYEGKTGTPTEPREVLVADVTGDGRNDLVLLVHDRVLVYPQE